MNISDEACKSLIGLFEGFSLKAYPDPGTKREPWTIGYGHTGGVKQGDICTKDQALKWLREDISEAEASISTLVKVPLSQNQFDALVSFVYNVGYNNLKHSTLLKRLNTASYEDAANEFTKWVYADGHVLNGLIKRREAEKAWFLK